LAPGAHGDREKGVSIWINVANGLGT
jgi:hypothetical protein